MCGRAVRMTWSNIGGVSCGPTQLPDESMRLLAASVNISLLIFCDSSCLIAEYRTSIHHAYQCPR